MSTRGIATLNVLDRSILTLHEETDGTPVNWSLSHRALARLAAEVQDSSVSAETGCGSSTLLLGASGAQHHCFTLSEDESDRIASAATAMNLVLTDVRYHIGDSAVTLPGSQLPSLDIVLIDGSHAFPYPILDWFFLASSLSVGGLLVVDDVWMPSVLSLVRYLDRESGWRSEADDGQTRFYRRMARDRECQESPFQDRWDVQGINSRVGRRNRRMRAYSRAPSREKVSRHPIITVGVLTRRAVARVRYRGH